MRRSLGGKELQIVLCYIIYIAYSFQCIFHRRGNSHGIHINHIQIWSLYAAACKFGLLGIFQKYLLYIIIFLEPQKKKYIKYPKKRLKEEKEGGGV